jgi:predicted dehydrogenase
MNTPKAASRRQFLKTTGLATMATLSLPAILKAQSAPAVVSGQNLNSHIHLGQIGCGSIADYYHFNNLKQMDDVRVVATCDAFQRRGLRMAANYNKQYGGEVAKAHDDFREILARADVDAVIIAAHDNWHTPMSIAAAKAGKDVYCQKPLAVDFSLTGLLRKVVREKQRVFQFGTQYRSGGPKARYRRMVQLVRNGYIGKLERIDLWSRDVSFDEAQYNVKPYGSTTEIPVPEGFNYDAWLGPSEIVPYTSDRATRWGGFHCPETSLGFLAGCGIHELGLAQWANKTDHTSPIRYAGTGTVPNEGIFRTLARWDVTCDYANGVKLRVMDCRTAKTAVGASLPLPWQDGDGVIFHGSEGWISDALGFCASDQKLWKTEFKSSDETLPLSTEHHRNFIDCIKSRQETVCPVEMAIRADTICHLVNAAARTGRAIKWNAEKEEIVGDAEAAKLLTRTSREKWRVWQA